MNKTIATSFLALSMIACGGTDCNGIYTENGDCAQNNPDVVVSTGGKGSATSTTMSLTTGGKSMLIISATGGKLNTGGSSSTSTKRQSTGGMSSQTTDNDTITTFACCCSANKITNSVGDQVVIGSSKQFWSQGINICIDQCKKFDLAGWQLTKYEQFWSCSGANCFIPFDWFATTCPNINPPGL